MQDPGSRSVTPNQSARTGIRPIAYRPAESGLPLETLTSEDIRDRTPAGHAGQIERVSFHVVVMLTSGSGTHEVDFERVSLRPGRVLHIRPQQVHRWGDEPYEARVVLFASSPLLPVWAPSPPCHEVSDTDWKAGIALIDWVAGLAAAPAGDARRNSKLDLVRDLLITSLRLDAPSGAEPVQWSAPFIALRTRIAGPPPWPRSIDDLAAELGYSARTLSRACIAATGLTAKDFIDEHVALEAQRQLAHTDRPVAAIAATLGFSEHTNFTKFFHRLVGRSPAQWREELSGSASLRT